MPDMPTGPHAAMSQYRNTSSEGGAQAEIVRNFFGRTLCMLSLVPHHWMGLFLG